MALCSQVCLILTGVVDLARAGVDGLEQLIDLFIRHLLAEVGQDVLELADADEARHVLVEDLEATAVLLGLAGIAEATGAVQDALEALKVDCVRIQLAYTVHVSLAMVGSGRDPASAKTKLTQTTPTPFLLHSHSLPTPF